MLIQKTSFSSRFNFIGSTFSRLLTSNLYNNRLVNRESDKVNPDNYLQHLSFKCQRTRDYCSKQNCNEKLREVGSCLTLILADWSFPKRSTSTYALDYINELDNFKYSSSSVNFDKIILDNILRYQYQSLHPSMNVF